MIPTITDAHLLPARLRSVNAFVVDQNGAGWADALVDNLLAALWFPRATRRIFISYRRLDASGVAHQLRDALLPHRFDVFLDDSTIPYAVDFQRELKWWLNDADLLILLTSDNYATSRWVLEEINFANGAGIGVVCLKWPHWVNGLPTHLSMITRDQIVELSQADFTGTGAMAGQQHLTHDGLGRLIRACHVQRVRALGQRIASMMPFAHAQLSLEGIVSDGDEFGELNVIAPDGSRTLVQVLPFRPTIDQLHGLHVNGQQAHNRPARVACFYPENDPTHPRIKALTWAVRAQRPNTTLVDELFPFVGSLL